MKLTDVLTRQCVKAPLDGTDKYEVIEELVDVLAKNGQLSDRDAVLKAVLDREATRSTGIGQGLAVPHGKSHALDRLVMAVGKPSEPIDFQSIDGKPVNLIVLLASPIDQTGPHIQALARLSRLMIINQFRREVDQAQTAEEIYQIIVKQEEQIP